MAIELEAKIEVADLAAVRERLRAAGATGGSRALEVNTFFDTPGHTLLGRDSGLRLRHARDLDNGEERHQLTYKGRQESGALKRREEIEVGITDDAGMTTLLDRLGYAPGLTFEKRRETWHLGGCTIDLDELPQLGTFVEIEGPDEACIMGVRQALGLASEPLVKTGYAHLVATWLKAHDPRERTLRFR